MNWYLLAIVLLLEAVALLFALGLCGVAADSDRDAANYFHFGAGTDPADLIGRDPGPSVSQPAIGADVGEAPSRPSPDLTTEPRRMDPSGTRGEAQRRPS